jgi:hypothetical protein
MERSTKDLLDALFDRVAALDDMSLRRLRAVWDEQDAGARTAIWQRVRRVLRATGQEQEMRAARDWLVTWVNDFATGAAYPYTGLAVRAVMDGRTAAVAPILDATAAIIAGDRLEADDERFLTRAMREALVRPVRRHRYV